jgi:hypothetical protein
MARPKPSSGLPTTRFWTACDLCNALLATHRKTKDDVFAPSIPVVRVPTESLKILIAALSSSVAY